MKKLLTLLLCAGLAGCVGTQAGWQQAELQRKGMPPAYIDGFGPGYQSGQKAGGNLYAQFSKDPVRYANDPLYHQGWDDGFAQGKGQYESFR